ncbi:ABC transporter substrate-binding protein [Eubacteriales bacterium OttesenSCG-928-N13]|nr:ABC transporter substrate-binding protein [Eubacteriales bacterium OttesenSCG-928-N13]
MKKVLSLVVALVLVFAMMAPALAEEKPYIAVISKGFQHQFWQTVNMGSQAAADQYGVEITFDGPPSESEISTQIDMLNAALAKNPMALCLAALDTESVTEQLLTAQEKGIPVVGFDSGVPNAPEGTIISTASTDNEAAGALAAEKMFEIPEIKAAIEAATPEAPVLLGAMSQDATSASVVGRTVGYLDRMYELVNGVKPGEVAITGHDKYNLPSESGNVAVELNILVPATTNITDCQTTAQGLLQMNPVSIFCSNEATVAGILAATTDGQDLDRTNGKFKDIIVVGFDAGVNQKTAVREGWFYGSVTQDPYMIGFYAVELAYKAMNDEPVDVLVDTGCQFYTAENMDDEMIAPLLYD